MKSRGSLTSDYSDIYTPAAIDALHALAPLDADRKELMAIRIQRRAERARTGTRIEFLDPDPIIPRTSMSVRDARAASFEGSGIPPDLQRQWIQGTGPAAKPNTPVAKSIRNVAYALLSGADGWMFDGEDALGQVTTMSLDNQRNLKLACHRDPVFLATAEQVAAEMNAWAEGFLGRQTIVDWRQQLDFTTRIFRARGLHLDDRHIQHDDGAGFSASIADVVLYVVNNQERMRSAGSSLVLYLHRTSRPVMGRLAPLTVRWASCWATVQYSPANGGRDTTSPFHATSRVRSTPHGSSTSR